MTMTSQLLPPLQLGERTSQSIRIGLDDRAYDPENAVETVEWDAAMDTAIWEALMSQVRAQLRASTSDECFARASELQMLARSEVASRGPRISDVPSFVAIGQPVLERSFPSQPDIVSASFVQISPMKSSRNKPRPSGQPVLTAGQHNMNPANESQELFTAWSGVAGTILAHSPRPLPLTVVGYPPSSQFYAEDGTSTPGVGTKSYHQHSPLPLDMHGCPSSKFHAKKGTPAPLLDTDDSKQTGIHEEYTPPASTSACQISPDGLDVGTETNLACAIQNSNADQGLSTNKRLRARPVRVAKKWADIPPLEPRKTAAPVKAKKKTSAKAHQRRKKSPKWASNSSSKLQKNAKRNVKKTSESGVCFPSDLDVISGRGGMTNRHKGNLLFRDEARQMRSVYRDGSTTKVDKYPLSEELVKRVKDYGGRFMARGDDGLWYEMDEGRARKKASQALREKKW